MVMSYDFYFHFFLFFFFFNDTATTEIYTLSLHDALPIRSGPGPRSAKKKYLQVACTNLLTCYFLGERTLTSSGAFVYSDLHGTVVVHDRYVNYDHFDGITHQLCTAHLLRDIEDAAQTYPDAKWPAQVAEQLRA